MFTAHTLLLGLACQLSGAQQPYAYSSQQPYAYSASPQSQYLPDPSTYTYEYKYDPNAAVSSQAEYTYDPANPSKPFNYQYKYVPSQNDFRSDIDLRYPAETLVDSALSQTSEQGAKIGEILRTLQSNKLIARALQSGSDDPCAALPANLDATVQGIVGGLENSKPQLTKVIAAIQDMKRYENYPSETIKSASRAIENIEPLLPVFTSLFKTNPACQESLDTKLKSANTKVYKRQAEPAFDVCADSSEFTRDVFLGVGELFNVIQEISSDFNVDQRAAQFREIDEASTLLRDGADILENLELAPLFRAATFSTECPTTLKEVARSLNQIAEVVNVVDARG